MFALSGAMRQRLQIRTRTLLLAALAVAIAAQSLSLFLILQRVGNEPREKSELDFLLQVYGEPGGVEYLEDHQPALPLFDPDGESWTLADQPLTEFAGQIHGLGVGPHGSSPFVLVALPDDATVGEYHKALASLAGHGICRVGVYAPKASREFVSLRSDGERPDDTFVPVYRVLSVKFDTGTNHDCVDRFPVWTPWGEYQE